MGIIQKNLVGIDIGTKNIKMVKVNGRGKVTHYAYVDLPDKVITNGRIESKQMLIETLRLARKKLGTSYKHCVLCLNSPDIVIRQITIPQMEEVYIRKNILLELADFLPISPDKYVVDYFITDRYRDGGEEAVPGSGVCNPHRDCPGICLLYQTGRLCPSLCRHHGERI